MKHIWERIWWTYNYFQQDQQFMSLENHQPLISFLFKYNRNVEIKPLEISLDWVTFQNSDISGDSEDQWLACKSRRKLNYIWNDF